MTIEDEVRRLLEIAQSDSDTSDPEVASIRRQLADAELTSAKYWAGLITREQAAAEGLIIEDVPDDATDDDIRAIIRAQAGGCN